jgi:hypothetical protein
MNWASWFVWGFGATIVLTSLMGLSQGIGLTRMNIPYMLGTLITPNRDRANLYGAGIHLVVGWLFSLVYVAAFHVTGLFHWWFGSAIGFVQGLFVLVVGMPTLPALHPRMASELGGPTVTQRLEPPGFMALNYGLRTPISVLLAHVVFGALLGLFYAPLR